MEPGLSLIYNERLIDLGPFGMLALTEACTAYMPLPAQQFGYAHWYDEKKVKHDRFQICTRHVPLTTLLATAAIQRKKMQYAAFSVNG